MDGRWLYALIGLASAVAVLLFGDAVTARPPETAQKPGFGKHFSSEETWFLRTDGVARAAVPATTLDPHPSMTVTVAADPPDIGVGGEVSLITVTVTDGFSHLVSDGTVVTLTTTLGVIEPSVGQTEDGLVTATLRSGEVPGEAVVQAAVGSVVGSAVVTFHPADVSIVKQIEPSRHIEPGQMISYTLTFHNEGLAVARAITITDDLPVQLAEPAFMASGVSLTVAPKHPFEWYAGDLPPGGEGVITITARVDPTYPWHTSESLFNEATISTATAEDDYNNNRSGSLAIVTTADMYIIKELNSPSTLFEPRSTIRYDVTVGNYGPTVPRSIVITDTFPEHTVWDFDTGHQEGFSRTLRDGSVIWATDVLTHSKQIIIWLRVEENAPGGAMVVNRAEVSTSTMDSDLSNNQAQSVPGIIHALNLTVASDVAPRAEPGQVLTYTITSRNVGTLPAPSAVLTDVLPPQVSFLRSNPAPSVVEGRAYAWQLGELRSGATHIIELVGQISPDTPIGSILTNTVLILTTTDESYTDDNWDQAGTIVVPGQPYTITVVAEPEVLSVLEPSSNITATVRDVWGNTVEDGTPVAFASTLGTITPTVTATARGIVTATLNPGTVSGVAHITVSAGAVTGTAQVIIRPGPVAVIELTTEPPAPTVEDVVTITLTAQDIYTNAVEDGTPAVFTTTLGMITPTLTATTAGLATATLMSTVPGTALITANVAGTLTETVTVNIEPGAPSTVTLMADPPSIEVGGASAVITATVRDRFGNAVADGTVVTYTTDLGMIDGGQVYTTTTSGGRAWAMLTSGKPGGMARVQVSVGQLRSEIVVPFTGYGYRLYLPQTPKGG